MRPTVAVKSGMPIEFDFRPIEQTGNVDLAVRKGAIYTLGNWPSTMPGPNRRHTLAECPTTAVPLHIGQASLTDCSCARRWQTVPVRITPDQAAALQRLDEANLAAAQEHPHWFATRRPGVYAPIVVDFGKMTCALITFFTSTIVWVQNRHDLAGFRRGTLADLKPGAPMRLVLDDDGVWIKDDAFGGHLVCTVAYVFSDGVESYYAPATCEVGVGGEPPGDCRRWVPAQHDRRRPTPSNCNRLSCATKRLMVEEVSATPVIASHLRVGTTSITNGLEEVSGTFVIASHGRQKYFRCALKKNANATVQRPGSSRNITSTLRTAQTSNKLNTSRSQAR
eukprot:m.369943 g.369943  ORF g.369943 m.369943 type:complete len:337 (+) comp16680_c1_seq28:1872-2882(+)